MATPCGFEADVGFYSPPFAFPSAERQLRLTFSSLIRSFELDPFPFFRAMRSLPQPWPVS